MAQKLDIIAPQLQPGTSAMTLARWLKGVGDQVIQNEPVAELFGDQMRAYIHSPATGMLSALSAQPGQVLLSGSVVGQVSIIPKDAIDWENFDQVTDILEDFASKSKDFNSLKDANDALSQLLGIGDNLIFQNMSIEKQNGFLQNVVDQYQQNGLSPAQVAQKLLEGLELRTPKYVQGPAAPGLGLRGPAGPTPGGMGGFGGVAQPHAYPAYPVQPVHPGAPYPPQPGYGAPLYPPQDASQWLPQAPPAHGYPTGYAGAVPPQADVPPVKPPQQEVLPPVKKDEDNR